MTQAGIILGTAAYMSPEQARGQPVDKRADIWAFGCVLYELLAGTRAFPGDDITDTLAAVVKLEPAWHALPADVSARVRQVLRVCLHKDPRQRGGDIAAIRLALEGAFETETPREVTPAPSSRPRTWPMAIAALLVGVLIAGVAAWYLRPAPPTPRVSRFALDLPAGAALQASNLQIPTIALSPDGSTVAYRLLPLGGPRNVQLVVRRLDALESRTVYQGECGSPFFSPDGAWVGFFSPDGKRGVLRKVAAAGGPPVVIGTLDSPSAPHGAVWTDDGSIIFGMHNQGLWRIPAAGGTAEPLARAASRAPDRTAAPAAPPDAAKPPVDHRARGRLCCPVAAGLLYSDQPDLPRTGEGGSILVRNLTTGEERVLVSGGSFAQYVPSGHLVYAFGDTLRAVRFDLDRLETIGTPRPVVNGVVTKTEGASEFAVSREGLLVYMAVPSTASPATLVWRDRSGRETPFGSGAIGRAQNPRLSPDGRRLAMSVAGDLWVYFVDGRPPIRLTTGGVFLAPLWSPDGLRVIAERGTNARGIVSIAADGSDPTLTEIAEPVHVHPHGWLNDGRDLVAVRLGGTADIVRWPLSNPKAITDVVATPGAEGARGASVSPDGRWLAYVSDQTGTDEVWVRPMPGPGAPIRVSPSGGWDPTWARTGKELSLPARNAADGGERDGRRRDDLVRRRIPAVRSHAVWDRRSDAVVRCGRRRPLRDAEGRRHQRHRSRSPRRRPELARRASPDRAAAVGESENVPRFD